MSGLTEYVESRRRANQYYELVTIVSMNSFALVGQPVIQRY
ncbi:MAG TPA: hypothetical protein VFB70_13265 [Pyrinomonadaceae bacterium]|nr:hypothetical protein [Pyrinomonadaceae bacterium]